MREREPQPTPSLKGAAVKYDLPVFLILMTRLFPNCIVLNTWKHQTTQFLPLPDRAEWTRDDVFVEGEYYVTECNEGVLRGNMRLAVRLWVVLYFPALTNLWRFFRPMPITTRNGFKSVFMFLFHSFHCRSYYTKFLVPHNSGQFPLFQASSKQSVLLQMRK